MCRKRTYGLLALALLASGLVLRPVPSEASPKKKRDWKAPFVFDEPRWQVSMTSNFATFNDYGNVEKNGKGASLCGLFRITRSISVTLETGYFYFQKVPDAPEQFLEIENTQAIKVEGLFRYDLDIIELHPYVAVGGSLYFFLAGIIHDRLDITNWGINLEAGLDFTLAGRVLFGFVFDYGWILRYAPPPGTDYPTFMQLAVRVGSVL
jgi:hypothetical protein